MEAAERAADYAKAAELKYGRETELQKQLEEREGRLRELKSSGSVLVKEEVDADDIAARGRPLDGHPGHPPDGGRDGEAGPHGGSTPPAAHRPGRGGHGRVRRHPSCPGRPEGPQAAHRLIHLPGPHRGGEDRAGARPGRVPVRRRERAGPDRHERVHGEVRRVAPGGRAAGLRGLRGGRPADRGGAPPAVPGGALRRDREGPSGRLQRPAPAAGRRPPDRCPGADRGLQEHGRDHDQQHRVGWAGGSGRVGRRGVRSGG